MLAIISHSRKISVRLPQLKTVSYSSTSVSSPKWNLISAVCLERTPVITPVMTPIEKEMSEMIYKVELFGSLKSDHELRQDREKKKSTKTKELEEADPDAASRQTSQDFEDACNEEYSKFQFASRTTSADASNNLKSTNRKLEKHLIYFIQNKNHEDKPIWELPCSSWENGESLRQTAEKALKQHLADPKVRFLGNAPWGVHTVKYSKFLRDKSNCIGTKIFFFKAQLLDANCTHFSAAEYCWLGREELTKYLEPSYHHTVSQFLIDED